MTLKITTRQFVCIGWMDIYNDSIYDYMVKHLCGEVVSMPA